MDLRQLQTFREVVERGSFSAAADALGVTQPAVSRTLRKLEQQLGAAGYDLHLRIKQAFDPKNLLNPGKKR